MHNIDFLPRRIRQQRGARRELQMQVATVVIVAGVLGALAYFNETRIAAADGERVAAEQRAHSLARQLEIVPELTAQLADGQIKRRISRELGSRVTINTLLAELAHMLPPSACLTSMECLPVDVSRAVSTKAIHNAPRKAGKAGRKAPTDKRIRMKITGIAPTAVDVADFIGRLGVSPLFTDVNMGYARTVLIDNNRREARSFEVTFLVAR